MHTALPTIAQRLDRLPWSRWHRRVVLALGVAWVLDGLEVTIVGSIGAILSRADTLALTAVQIGWSGSLYVGGAVLGALGFGVLTDRYGRKRLLLTTLAVYATATLATACTTGFASFGLCRFATGLGIGGEYAAINSAIDELIPARLRGRVNLAINGSFWIGAALGGALSLILLDPRVLGPVKGWRACFATGAVLALAVVAVRRTVPESPRWLQGQGREEEAMRVVADIESHVDGRDVRYAAHTDVVAPPRRRPLATRALLGLLVHRYRRRSAVALALMLSQAFLYNAIFFTYGLVLTKFDGVRADRVALYLFPFALFNVLGPLILGPWFDRIGRRRMIALTYCTSGVGLALTALAFEAGWLDAMGQTLCWSFTFFFASAAASSAYLTVSEVFPLEMRGFAIATFYAVGTGVGGFAAPLLLGWLIGSGRAAAVASGYFIGAALVFAAGLIALRYGIDAERKPLEEIALHAD